jgi:hypothetical protein
VSDSLLFRVKGVRHIPTSSGTDLDVKSGDADLLASGSNILGSQHGSVGRGLVTVGLDLHSTSDSADGFTATGITQSQPRNSIGQEYTETYQSTRNIRKIGNVDESVIERGEDTGNAENKLACRGVYLLAGRAS